MTTGRKDPNQNRPGYRKTKVGWIPEEWRALRLTSVAKLESGHTPSRKKPEYWNGNVPWISLHDTETLDARHICQTIHTISLQGLENSSARLLPKGTVVFSRTATIGKACIMGVSMATSQDFANYVCGSEISNKFLVQLLRSMKTTWRSLMAGSTHKTIYMPIFEKLQIPLPPVSEQKRIALILSIWDSALEKARRLLEGKRRRKKALMQRLLTGKKRLPGFGAKWSKRHLGDLFDEREETGCAHLPLLAVTGSRGVIPAEDIERKDSSSEDKSLYKRIVPGDIGYNTMRMWQGVSALSGLEGIISPAYTVCVPKPGVYGPFMAYYFKFPAVVYLFWRYSQGLVSDTLNLKYHHFAQIRVDIPEEGEQRAIAAVFQTTDEELSRLEAVIDALERQKRGLMQKLLTGTIRVVPPTAGESS